MNSLYLDLPSGISGDMLIGALLDLGVEVRSLERELSKLGIDDYHLHVHRGQKCGIAGTKFTVHLAHDHAHDPAHDHEHKEAPPHEAGDAHAHPHPHEGGHHRDHPHPHSHPQEHGHSHNESHAGHGRTFRDIRDLIDRSALPEWVRLKAVAVFRRIAEAEGKIHGHPADHVHFHEVGAVDSIVDIVGACLALDLLGRPRVLASPVTEGTGFVRCAHGRFPLPAPATLEILGARGIAVTQCDEPNELVTPTGAALLAEFAESTGPMESLVARRIGYGLGTRDHLTRPNVLRAILGDSPAQPAAELHDWETDRVAVVETNLDDVPAEVLGHVVDLALSQGALDVFHTSVQMKKNRPGTLLTILCAEADADQFSELLLRQTSAFGVRRTLTERRKLRRESRSVRTPHGEVTVKLGMLDGRVVQSAPEYESCARIAAASGLPLKQVYEAALRALG